MPLQCRGIDFQKRSALGKDCRVHEKAPNQITAQESTKPDYRSETTKPDHRSRKYQTRISRISTSMPPDSEALIARSPLILLFFVLIVSIRFLLMIYQTQSVKQIEFSTYPVPTTERIPIHQPPKTLQRVLIKSLFVHQSAA